MSTWTAQTTVRSRPEDVFGRLIEPDSIRRCKAGVDGCTLADWTHVSAVQVYLLARNLSPSPDYADAKSYAMGLAGTLPPTGDRYKRRLYSALIVARNLAGPREH